MSKEWRLVSSESVRETFRQQILDEIDGLVWIQSAADPARSEELVDADIHFGLVPAESIPSRSRLRWIQFPFAGVPISVCRRAKETGIVITNVSGIYDRTIAEHVLGLMLALARRFDLAWQFQQSRTWAHPAFPFIEDLAGQTAGIVGLGSLGQAVAQRLKLMGMRVVGCRRSERPTPFVDQLYVHTELARMAAACRWLVITLPLTPETKGMVDREVLSSLPRGSRVVNVGRGAVLDHDALSELIMSEHLAGAALDVLPTEPLPVDSPLWDLPRTIITPHCSGNPADSSTSAAQVLLRNLHRFVRGEPLENVVHLDRGY